MTGCLHVAGGPEVQRLGLGAVALRYQRMGYAVLPLAPAAKRPHRLFAPRADGELAGVHWATRSPAMVEHVWGQDRLAGIGIATGRANGLVVIDLDVKNGADGVTQFYSLMDAWSLPLQPGPVQHTPSGGMHIWLRMPPGMVLPGRTSILPGVDIKSDGGYVAAAPTHIWQDSLDGGRALVPYRMQGCPCRLPWAPDWLIDWVLNAPGQAAGGTGQGEASPSADLAELQARGLPRGERNVTLHRLACQLFGRYGTGPDGIMAVRGQLETVFANTDMRGFPAFEAERTIESARRWVEEQHRLRDEAYNSVFPGRL